MVSCARCGERIKVTQTDEAAGRKHAANGGEVGFECKECHKLYCMSCAGYIAHGVRMKNSWGGDAFYCDYSLRCDCVNTQFRN